MLDKKLGNKPHRRHLAAGLARRAGVPLAARGATGGLSASVHSAGKLPVAHIVRPVTEH
jgi:hypothetical protein